MVGNIDLARGTINRVRGLLVVALQTRNRRRSSRPDVCAQSVSLSRLGESLGILSRGRLTSGTSLSSRPTCHTRVRVGINKSKTAETRTGVMSNYGWSTGTTGYDDEDRLVSWTRDDNNLSQSWTLTSEGDWSQFVENSSTENRTHGPAHELTAIGSTALSYDPKGNLTVDDTKNHNYTWDFDNRMSAADTDGDNTDDVTLKYDALGRRIAKTAGTNAVVYVSMTQPIQYSPFAGQVVAEYASGALPASPTEKYVYGPYIDEPVLKDGTGGTVYYHRNSQYSVAALTSASGAAVERYGYEPCGELTILAADGSTVRASSSYANSYTYTGRRWDAELKLYYFRARYYDPGLGRFVGWDPLSMWFGLPGGCKLLAAPPVCVLDPSGFRPCRIDIADETLKSQEVLEMMIDMIMAKPGMDLAFTPVLEGGPFADQLLEAILKYAPLPRLIWTGNNDFLTCKPGKDDPECKCCRFNTSGAVAWADAPIEFTIQIVVSVTIELGDPMFENSRLLRYCQPQKHG